MPKKLFLPFISMIFIAVQWAQAKDSSIYMAASYGPMSSKSDIAYFDGTDGNVIGVDVGKRFSSLALEMLVRKGQFDEKSTSISIPSIDADTLEVTTATFTYSTKMTYLTLGPALRWFFLGYFNVRAGFTYNTLDLGLKVNGVARDTKDSGTGLYYGGGLQLPLGRFDFFADYTINDFSDDVSANEISGGLRLYW